MSTMIVQQHILVALAALFLVMNVLGLAFTIWRNRQRRLSSEAHSHPPLAKVW
jgi:uncharacterized membrane protein YqjE